MHSSFFIGMLFKFIHNGIKDVLLDINSEKVHLTCFLFSKRL